MIDPKFDFEKSLKEKITFLKTVLITLENVYGISKEGYTSIIHNDFKELEEFDLDSIILNCYVKTNTKLGIEESIGCHNKYLMYKELNLLTFNFIKDNYYEALTEFEPRILHNNNEFKQYLIQFETSIITNYKINVSILENVDTNDIFILIKDDCPREKSDKYDITNLSNDPLNSLMIYSMTITDLIYTFLIKNVKFKGNTNEDYNRSVKFLLKNSCYGSSFPSGNYLEPTNTKLFKLNMNRMYGSGIFETTNEETVL